MDAHILRALNVSSYFLSSPQFFLTQLWMKPSFWSFMNRWLSHLNMFSYSRYFDLVNRPSEYKNSSMSMSADDRLYFLLAQYFTTFQYLR